jgi:hypothetical protein
MTGYGIRPCSVDDSTRFVSFDRIVSDSPKRRVTSRLELLSKRQYHENERDEINTAQLRDENRSYESLWQTTSQNMQSYGTRQFQIPPYKPRKRTEPPLQGPEEVEAKENADLRISPGERDSVDELENSMRGLGAVIAKPIFHEQITNSKVLV